MSAAEQLRETLLMLRAPQKIVDEVVFADSVGQWPPRPGFDRTPGIGSIRIWTDCDLLAWFDAAADDGVAVFGPDSRDEIAALAQAATAARACGEGAHALWGLDVLSSSDYRAPLPDGAHCALWANDLVCFGPYLRAEQIAQIQTLLDGAHGGHGRQQPNEPVTVHQTTCFATVWMGAVA